MITCSLLGVPFRINVATPLQLHLCYDYTILVNIDYGKVYCACLEVLAKFSSWVPCSLITLRFGTLQSSFGKRLNRKVFLRRAFSYVCCIILCCLHLEKSCAHSR